ncbi:MAG: HAMP domain-containing histidine kinase, partial [Gorillibacterium sp.]|nr:HAMP domain-containing histidine kinase [Gorillibacterium sp.]
MLFYQHQKGQQKQSFLRIMLDELTQIERIVNDLVLLAKPAGAEGRAQRMVDILERAMQETEPEAAVGGVRMEMRAPSESPWVKCSPGQLSQMFCNILRNAVQAMPNGGVIQIVVTEEADWVVVQIIDEGTGIPDERLPHLGEPFFTT